MKSRASPPRPTMAEIARDPSCLDRWKQEYREYCAWVTKEFADLRAAERGPLTAAERTVIDERSDGYHECPEFWLGFASYDCGRDCNNPWEENSDAGQAWDRGTEAAMYIHWTRTSCPYARDDLDSLKLIATLRGLNKRQRAGREKLVRLIHARRQDLAARQPRLVVDNTK